MKKLCNLWAKILSQTSRPKPFPPVAKHLPLQPYSILKRHDSQHAGGASTLPPRAAHIPLHLDHPAPHPTIADETVHYQFIDAANRSAKTSSPALRVF